MTDVIPYAVASRGLLRETVLDAAGEHLRERPWSEVTMAGVAAVAGVSRQTLYNAFGSRHELAQAYVLREADRFIGAVSSAIATHLDDPGAALAAAFDVFLDAAADDPFVRAVIANENSDELLPLVTTQGQPLLTRATDAIAAIVVDGWPQVAQADAILLAECLVRLAISHAALPSGPARMDGAAVRRLLGPLLREAVGD